MPSVLSLVLLAGLAPSCGQAPSTPQGPLAGQDCLVIVLDALAAGALGCQGAPDDPSPRIDGLAAQGVNFQRAWSQTAWTLPSTASLMTGLYQESHGVQERRQVLGDRVRTLAEAFSDAGYQTHALSENPYASPVYGFAQGFDDFQTLFGDTRKVDRRVVADGVLELLNPDADRSPRFVYAHFRRPHTPYDAPKKLRRQFIDPDYSGSVSGHPDEINDHNLGTTRLGPADVSRLRDLYAATIKSVDRQVGRILDGIDLDRTLVLLLSDHGEAFNQHGLMGHSLSAYEEMVHIPFIAAHPSLASGTAPSVPVMSIDVLPTLAELFGLEIDLERVQGRSLVPELMGRAGPEREAVFTSSQTNARQMFAVFDGRWKYVRKPESRQEELYDLIADPDEQHDLARERPHELNHLRGLFDAWWQGQEPEPDVTIGRLTLDAAELFRALGYVSGPESYSSRAGGPRRTEAPVR